MYSDRERGDWRIFNVDLFLLELIEILVFMEVFLFFVSEVSLSSHAAEVTLIQLYLELLLCCFPSIN